MGIGYAGQWDVQSNNENITTSGAATADGASFDLQNIEGTAQLEVNDRASGTAAASIAVTHSEDDSTFVAVPADALFDLDTGQASTFSNLSTSASVQAKGLNVQKLKRYLRVEFTGTDIDHHIATILAGIKQYTGGIG